ncbi:hypothetical protein DITRI_Ditri02bG0154400 [Diplodiscus trichospermus]
MIKKTARPPLSSDLCCIYKVSQRLRKENENAYTPRTVSIGPLHYGDENLKRMEEVKVRYLEQFLRHAAKTAKFNKLSHRGCQKAHQIWEYVDDRIRNDFSCLDEFLRILKSSEQKIRQSYAEDLSYLTSEKLLKIILVDAAFIIELFLRSHFHSKGDTILSTPFLRISVRMDLWLLENQVPFFVLEELYSAAFGSWGITIYPPSFLDLAREFFQNYNEQKRPTKIEIKHFTDLLRTFFLPITKAEEQSSKAGAPEVTCSDRILKTNFTGFLRYCGLLSKPVDQEQPSYYKRERSGEQLKSATQLHAAGVKFHTSSSKCLLDINFSNPKLEIPCLHLYDDTEAVFRNLMALEQYHYPAEALISDYVTLMDYLINTSEDAGLLVEKRIINNWLGSNEKVASLFNRLCTYIAKGFINQRFNRLIQELNAYYVKPWHGWKATFRRQYCSTPWKPASTTAAVILPVLTLVQTILTAVAL